MKKLLLLTAILSLSCNDYEMEDGMCKGTVKWNHLNGETTVLPAVAECYKCGQNIIWTCPSNEDCGEFTSMSSTIFYCN